MTFTKSLTDLLRARKNTKVKTSEVGQTRYSLTMSEENVEFQTYVAYMLKTNNVRNKSILSLYYLGSEVSFCYT